MNSIPHSSNTLIMTNRWKKQIAPRRPSSGLVKIYRQAALNEEAKNADSKWGLLGCTPEIRTLAGELTKEITCIDVNENAYWAYQPLCVPSKNEKFLCSNWLSLNNICSFDLVFGDGSIAMLPIGKHEELLGVISKLLKPGGLAALRVFLYGKSCFNNIREIFEWYDDYKRNVQIDFAVMHYLQYLFIDPETLRIEPEIIKNKFTKLVDSGEIDHIWFSNLEQIDFGRAIVQYTIKELFESQASKFFTIEDICYADDYPDSKNSPIYLLRK
jgi:SAM-dependent methyltransferase